MSRIMFFLMILAIIFGANFYVFWRLWHMVPEGNPLRWGVAVFGIAVVSSVFIAVILGEYLPQGIAGFLYKSGTSWIFFMVYFLLLFLLADILRLCGLPLQRYMFGSWTGLAVSAGVVAAVIIAGNIKYYDKRRVELRLEVEKPLPPQGLKIVAVSDLHLGYTIGKRELAEWVGLINAENPDVVLIAGDIADKRSGRLNEEGYAGVLRTIKSKYGVFASLGNHEYINNLSESIEFLANSGITLLRDTAVLVDSLFYIVGRDDRTNPKRAELNALTAGLDPSVPAIVLDHQPYELGKVAENGVDLQISGHTHHGQVWPLSWITDAMYEKAYGYLRKGDSHIYVSSGIGIWGGKYRIGTQSEYAVIIISND